MPPNQSIVVLDSIVFFLLLFVCPYLLVAGDSSINGSIHYPIQTHAEQVDVAVVMAVLVLADERAQFLVLVLYHIYSVL